MTSGCRTTRSICRPASSSRSGSSRYPEMRGGGPSLSGSGTASGFGQFLNLSLDACKPPNNIDLGYVLRTSGQSLDDYVGGFSQYAVSSVTMTEGQKQQLDTGGRTAGYAPILASGEVFAFRIYDPRTQNQVTHLTLTPSCSRGSSRTVEVLEHTHDQGPEPGRGVPVDHRSRRPRRRVRGDPAGHQMDLGERQAIMARRGKGVPARLNPFTGPTDTLPSLASLPNPVALVSYANIMANTVRTGGSDYGSLSQYGTIGYMDSSVAARYGLATVTIKFPNGKKVTPSTRTIRRIGAMHKGHLRVFHPNYGLQSSAAW